MSKTTFSIPSELASKRIRIALIGAGGTGSEVFDGLLRLHKGLVALGHPGGLHVTVYDADEVSESNTVRQRFYEADIGRNKAELLVHRANTFHGLDWQAVPKFYDPANQHNSYVLIIGCVDKATFRVELAKRMQSQHRGTLWLDCGNGSTDGQFCLGHLGGTGEKNRLPNIFDLYPNLVDAEDDDAPSCSAAEALRSQDLFVNRVLADQAVNLLYRLLRDGEIDYHGGFVNVKTGEVRRLPIDPAMWAAFGYVPQEVATA